MPAVFPFKAIYPRPDLAQEVISQPYDVLTRSQAKQQAKTTNSFLHISRAEIDLPLSIDQHDSQVHIQAKTNFERFLAEKILIQADKPSIYLYASRWQGHMQSGIVACVAVADYLNGKIKRHELTLASKEADRIRHFSKLNTHTEAVFLTYPKADSIAALYRDFLTTSPLLSGKTPDGVEHFLWELPENTSQEIIQAFAQVDSFYIADGHHRSASAAKVCQEKAHLSSEAKRFLAVIIPEEDLTCLSYNRVIKDWGNTDQQEFIQQLEKVATCIKSGLSSAPELEKMGEFGLCLPGEWQHWCWKENPALDPDQLPESLDVSRLQAEVLAPLLDIDDPRTNERISFIGGIHGWQALELAVQKNEAVCAFYLYPTQIAQVIKVADQGKIMPPKSTWFEPKLASGLFLHSLES